MKEWWQWSPMQGGDHLGFAIIGVGRFGIAVCRELLQNGADVLAVDRSERAVDELRQVVPSVEARVLDCTDEEALRRPACSTWAPWWWRSGTDRGQHHRHLDRQRQ